MARRKVSAKKAVAGGAKKRGRGRSPGSESRGTQMMSPQQMVSMRDLFWGNVVREMLNGLSILCQQQPEQFDGRFGVLTSRDERIPIGHITPLFACSIPGSAQDREASAAVQSTVFRIQTPEGEVFTLPVQEIRAIHTMTPELIEQLQALSENEAAGEKDETRPFGLAAFAALPKGPIQAEPEGPTE